MKLTTVFICLAAGSTTLVSAAATSFIDTSLPFYQKLTKPCLKDFKLSEFMQECRDGINFIDKNKIKESCRITYSEKCVKFSENLMATLPNCANDAAMIEYSNYIRESMTVTGLYYCTLNGDNQLCPSVRSILYGGKIMEDLDCDYKSCIDNQIKLHEMNIKYNQFTFENLIHDQEMVSHYNAEEDRLSHNEKINMLNSIKCTSQVKDDTGNTKLFHETDLTITDVPFNLQDTTESNIDTNSIVDTDITISPNSNVSTSSATSFKVMDSLLSLLLLYVIF